MKHWKFPLYLQKTPLFEAAREIVDRLQKAQYTTYFVGGAVRDAYLGRKISEIDIVTSAKPDEVCRLFPQHKLVGAHFGVVLVNIEKFTFDVATFRMDGLYINGRHPISVEFSDAQHDALRRDFTINGLFYDPIAYEIVDYVDGLKDLDRKIIRSIGHAKERFQEDHLRMLRGIRFSAQLSQFDFSIDAEVIESIVELSSSLSDVSRERIRSETFKILQYSKDSREIDLLFQTKLSKNIFPSPTLSKRARNLLNALLPKKISFALKYLAIVWENIQNVEALSDTFLLTKQDLLIMKSFVLLWGALDSWESLPLWKKKRLLRGPFTAEILKTWEDWIALYRPEKIEISQQIAEFYEKEGAYLFPQKLISGHTLLQMGLPPSPRFKEILDEVENQQLEGVIHNEEDARQFLEKLL